MARFFVLLATVAIFGLTSAQNKPKQLLSFEQQQELLDQLAQLQRQTQQLLAAQQSLAAVAAAAGVTNPQQNQAHPTQSSNNVLLSSPRSPVPSISVSKPKQQQVVAATKPSTVTVSSSTSNGQSSSVQSPPLPTGPQINWGKCPELEPSEHEKLAKAGVITKCLETTPLPGNITRESVEQHREQIAACALRAEGWFTNAGGYDYSKAEKEIKNKRMHKDLEQQVLSYHSQCKAESEEKYPAANSSIIAQIQLYQACMDYFISDVCGIEVNEPEAAQFN